MHETNYTEPDGTYVSYSNYSHPYQLRGEGRVKFKTRTFRSYESMQRSARKVLNGPDAPPYLVGYRHFNPGGRGRALHLIEIFYADAVAEKYPPRNVEQHAARPPEGFTGPWA
jgi:hypothetical protein